MPLDPKLLKKIQSAIDSYILNVNKLPETVVRNQALFRFQESVMWLEKHVNALKDSKDD